MKKFIILGLAFLLFGCVESSVLEVKHQDSGYTSELVGTISKDEAIDIVVMSSDVDNFLAHCYNKDGTVQQFQIDFDNKTINEVEYSNNMNTAVMYENDEYKITVEYSQEYDSKIEKVIYIATYTYITNEKTSVLYQVKGKSTFPDENVRLKKLPDEEKVLFFIEDYQRNVLSICEVIDGKLKEINAVDLEYKGHQYSYSEYYNKQYVHLFDSEDSILILMDENELLYEKEIEDHYTLSYYNIWDQIVLEYENEDSIMILRDDNKKVIPKNIDDYDYYGEYTEDVYLYEKHGYKLLLMDDYTYELGYLPKYYIKDDYVLCTFMNKEIKDYQSIFIDRKNNKTYTLTEAIDLSECYECYDSYLIKDGNRDNPFSIISIDNHEITSIDLPFSSDFQCQTDLDENRIVYIHDTIEGMEYYLVTLEE